MKKNNIFIELTPLLDVILIMLFFILVQGEGRIEAFYDEAREVFEIQYIEAREAFEAELAVIRADTEVFVAQHADEMYTLRAVNTEFHALLDTLDGDMGIIIISLLEGVGTNRRITVEADSRFYDLTLTWDNLARDNTAFELNTILTEINREANSSLTMIIFRFDSRTVFAQDHRLVSNVIHIQRQFNPRGVFTVDINIGV